MSTQPRSPRRRVAAFGRRFAFWLVLVVALSQVLAFGGVYSWSWVPAQMALALGFVYILAGNSRRRTPMPWTAILIPVAAFGLLVFVQWAGSLSIYPALTLTSLIQLSAGGLMLYLSFYAIRSSSKNLPYLSEALWIFTGLLSAEAILQYFDAGKLIYWLKDATYATPVGPFVYHNHYAGLLDLLLPVSVAATFWPLSEPRPDWMGMVRRAVCPLLAFISLILSQSRGGAITFGVEVLLALVIFWRPVRALGSKKLVLGLVICVAVAGLANWKPLLARFSRLEYHDTSATYRVAVAEACLRIWRASPWVGSGFGTFEAIYPAYESFDAGMRWDHAHNEYAQALAETGIAGGMLILTFVFLLLRTCWRRTSTHPSSQQINAQAWLIGLLGFLFHSYGDFLFHAPGDMLMFFMLAGAVTAGATHSRGHRRLVAVAADGQAGVAVHGV